LACGKLQIRKLHRPPYEPQPGGLVERVFQTIGSQFADEVQFAKKTYSLVELNQAFLAYLDTTYHRTVHSQTHQTPHDRYFSQHRLIRPVAIESIQSYFFDRVVRKVDSTHSDVVIDTRYYKVDRRWRGMKVYVQFDSFRFDGQLIDEVSIFSEQDVFLGIATRYDRQRGSHGEPVTAAPTAQPPDRSLVIEAYLAEHKKLQATAEQGIDYKTAMRHGQLTLASLANLLSKTLGRPGGLSAFTASEQAALETFYRRHPQVRSLHVQEAAKQAGGDGLAWLLWQLEILLKGENP
jgi:hypothetical protein